MQGSRAHGGVIEINVRAPDILVQVEGGRTEKGHNPARLKPEGADLRAVIGYDHGLLGESRARNAKKKER
jgi:hypothetical protein